MKIDKHLAYKIAGSGFKLQHISTGFIFDIESIHSNNREFYIYTDEVETGAAIPFDKIGTDYKVISRTMDLTKPITVQGKEVVPVKELFEVTYGGLWNDDFMGFRVIHDNLIKVSDSANELIVWTDKLCFQTKAIAPDGENEWEPPFNQPYLFQWLEKHHFCYFLDEDMIVEMDEVYNS